LETSWEPGLRTSCELVGCGFIDVKKIQFITPCKGNKSARVKNPHLDNKPCFDSIVDCFGFSTYLMKSSGIWLHNTHICIILSNKTEVDFRSCAWSTPGIKHYRY